MHSRSPLLVRSGRIDEWLDKFTSAQIRLMVRMYGSTMRKLGYDVDALSARASGMSVRGTENGRDAASAKDSGSTGSTSLVQRLLGENHRLYELRKYQVQRGVLQAGWSIRTAIGMARNAPAVLHITHHETNSQCVAQILRQCVARSRFVSGREHSESVIRANLRPGAVFPAVCLQRDQVETATADFHGPIRRLVVIRDLRDTLVSRYYSLRDGHEGARNTSARETLIQLSVDEGMLWLLHGQLQDSARMQNSWIHAEDRLLVRYEDLVADAQREFARMLEYSRIRIGSRLQRNVIGANPFVVLRDREPDVQNAVIHLREGGVGDWRNHFTEELKVQFKALYGSLLIETGYETGMDW
jgi:lipopolysaccharide transport system ATP-binding protein